MGMSDMVSQGQGPRSGATPTSSTSGVDKGADMAAKQADDMSGGKHSDQIDKGRDMAADKSKDVDGQVRRRRLASRPA